MGRGVIKSYAWIPNTMTPVFRLANVQLDPSFPIANASVAR
jgi:hypothetical protein